MNLIEEHDEPVVPLMIVVRVGNRSPAWLCFENPVNENESR